jgi:hypothetical protein
MQKLFFGSSAPSEQKQDAEPFTLLVIQQDAYDWQEIMKTALPQMKVGALSQPLKVIQTSWNDLEVGTCDNYRKEGKSCPIYVRRLWKHGRPVEDKISKTAIYPNFVLIRNEVVVPSQDFSSKLLGLMYADIPSINSLRSIYLTIERPVMMSALNKIASKSKFPMPIIPQEFVPSHLEFFYSQKFPAVVKFGSAHAGLGKLVVDDHHRMEEVRDLLPMTSSGYAFCEPFLKESCNLRLLKIGNHYRATKRISVSQNWRIQLGSCMRESIPVEERYKYWLDAASTMFGDSYETGKMDILTIDVLVEEGTGAEFILEVNGTSSGLGEPEEAEIDNLEIAKIVLGEISKLC